MAGAERSSAVLKHDNWPNAELALCANPPYFVKNQRIAVGLAVLPEDEQKSRVAKRHPHQSEVICVIDGILRLEVDEEGQTSERILEQGQVYVIHPGRCHRITSIDERSAAYLFVKTNPVEEPREEYCHSNDHPDD